MSGSISPLALALLNQSGGSGNSGSYTNNTSIPLASMSMAPNAVGLQQQYGSMPWYAVPGMFQQPPAQTAQAAVAPAAPQGMTPNTPLTPEQLAMVGLGSPGSQ